MEEHNLDNKYTVKNSIFYLYNVVLSKKQIFTCSCKRDCNPDATANSVYVWFESDKCYITHLWKPTYSSHRNLSRAGFTKCNYIYTKVVDKDEFFSSISPSLNYDLRPISNPGQLSKIINQAQFYFKERLSDVHTVSEMLQFFVFADIEWNINILELLNRTFETMSFSNEVKTEFLRLSSQLRKELNNTYIEDDTSKKPTQEKECNAWDNPKPKSQWVHIIYNAMRK